MPQTADFVYASSAALTPGQYVSLVSNKDGVTKFVATVPSSALGAWTINPKPPAGTYSLYTGLAQGALTTLVDPDYVVDPFDDQQNTFLPGYLVVGNAVGGAPFAPTLGDALVNRGGVAPGSGAVYFGSSAGLHSLIYDGVKFNLTDPLYIAPAIGPPQYAPGIGARVVGASVEFGHTNQAGYGSVLGDESGSGKPYVAFHAGPGTNANTYKTLGIKGVIYRSDLVGGMEWDTLATANADNQAPTAIMQLSAAGTLTLPLGNLLLTSGLSQLIQLTDNSGTPNKYLRANSGVFQILASDGVTGIFQVTNLGSIQIPIGQGLDTITAGLLQIATANATMVAVRGPQKSLIVGKTLTTFGAGAQTLTAAQLLGGDIEHTVTAAVADTTDTGANLDAAIVNPANGDTIECYLTIIGAFTVTLTAGAGITIKGTTALLGTATGKTAHLIFRRTAISTWTCYVVFST